ncbi:MAG: peptide-methionine (S)-S-oxide reductase MsrA [Acidobacteriota bacterium]
MVSALSGRTDDLVSACDRVAARPSAAACAPLANAEVDDLSILGEIEERGLARATFGGGCFWCMEPPFDKLDGVEATVSGYIGGFTDNPTYQDVAADRTGHAEVVQVIYDPETITYAELLDVFWRNIDPTVANRQFCDRGSQYRTGIFFHGDEQQQAAEASKQAIIDSGRFPQVVTEVTAASTFYVAEEYHQDFYVKKPGHYKRYRVGCGRDARLEKLWGEAK